MKHLHALAAYDAALLRLLMPFRELFGYMPAVPIPAIVLSQRGLLAIVLELRLGIRNLPILGSMRTQRD